MLESMLRDNMDEIVGAVASATEAGATESQNLVTTVIGILQDEAAAGRLDLDALLKGDTSQLKDALNFAQLGGLLGGGADAGEKGVHAMLTPVSETLRTVGSELGGVDDLLRQILDTGATGGGGILGAVGDLLGGVAGSVAGAAGGGDDADGDDGDGDKDA